MALSEQQKAANRAAKLARDRAYRARYAQYRKAEDTARSSEELVTLRATAEEFDKQLDARMAAIDAKRAELNAKIEEIRRQIDNLGNIEGDDSLPVKRNAAWQAWRERESELLRESKLQFPDLEGAARWSVCAWTPPQKVLAEMEAARAEAALLSDQAQNEAGASA